VNITKEINLEQHLETVDDMISMVHSKRHSDDYYSLKDYERDLERLIELRSLLEDLED